MLFGIYHYFIIAARLLFYINYILLTVLYKVKTVPF